MAHSESAVNNALTVPSHRWGRSFSINILTATLTNKTFGDNVSFGDNNITNVGDIAVRLYKSRRHRYKFPVVFDNSATAFY